MRSSAAGAGHQHIQQDKDEKNFESFVLETWVGYQTKPPTWLTQIRHSWKIFTFRICAILIVVWFLAESELRMVAFFATGMLLGSLIRDLDWMRKAQRTWPVFSNYLDWGKINESYHRLNLKKVEQTTPERTENRR